jgi:putative FmdB family regulatory protein
MPIYEYSCAKCGAIVELIQPVSAPPPAEHADCGGPLAKRPSAPRVSTEVHGLPGSTNSAMLRFEENRKAEERKTSAARSIVDVGDRKTSGTAD